MPITKVQKFTPKIHSSVFVASDAQVMGQVEIGEDSGIWFGSVLRGDMDRISIGKRTNIQDLTMIHVDDHEPTLVGDGVTVGHRVILHACEIGDEVLIGMGAIVMNGAVIARHCILGAGSLVTPGTKIPEGVLALGSPAKPKRDLTPDEIESILTSAEHYVQNREKYR